MAQLGHMHPAFTLRVYTHGTRRGDDEKAPLRALVGASDWVLLGTDDEIATAEGSEPTSKQGLETTQMQGFPSEPEPGLEPGTCRLQGGCSTS